MRDINSSFNNKLSIFCILKKGNGCQKLKEVGKGKLLFNGNRVAVWEDDKILEMNGGDSCTM